MHTRTVSQPVNNAASHLFPSGARTKQDSLVIEVRQGMQMCGVGAEV